MNIIQLVGLAFAAQGLAACASTETRTPGDPLEPLNRKVFGFNYALDRAVIVPLTKGYVAVTPSPLQTGIANAFDNVGEPATFANQILQGKPQAAAATLIRFSVNSTLGIVGLFDLASGCGLSRGDEDLGQTLGVWGMDSGPYLVLPLLGSSSARGLLGQTLSVVAAPSYYIEDEGALAAYHTLRLLSTSAEFLDARAALTGDRYLLVRDAYVQRREFLVRDGEVTAEDPFLDD